MSANNILIFLDGEPPSLVVAKHFTKRCDIVIATDGAAKYARSMGIGVHVVIGDLDSLDNETRILFEQDSIPIIHNSSQYSTDFEKALEYCIANYDVGSVFILGIHGKRTDHVMTNFSVMLRYSSHLPLKAYDATHEHYFLHDGLRSASIKSVVETKLSLTPMPIANGVQTNGLFYPINGEDMAFGEREGLSNIVAASPALVTISSGSLLISIPHGIEA
jgi:thiamine pyrophosphokinase